MSNKKTDILELLADLTDSCCHEYIDDHDLLDKLEEIREFNINTSCSGWIYCLEIIIK